jgi:hypothetical protein
VTVAATLGHSSELEVPFRGCSPATISTRGREQALNSTQAFPSRLVQSRVGADEISDHVPGGNVERALRRRSHREGDRALRTETDPLGRGLLPRSDANSLSEHIYSDGFVSRLEFPIAAKTTQVFQSPFLVQRRSRRACHCGRECSARAGRDANKNTRVPSHWPQVCREIPASSERFVNGLN